VTSVEEALSTAYEPPPKKKKPPGKYRPGRRRGGGLEIPKEIAPVKADGSPAWEEAPHPDGPMPDDSARRLPVGWMPWNATRWEAYRKKHEGLTWNQISIDLQVSSQTTSDWVRCWRRRYGPQLLRGTWIRKGAKVPVDRAGYTSAPKTSTDRLHVAIEELDEIGGYARKIVIRWLQGIITDEDYLRSLTLKQVAELSELAKGVEQRAVKLRVDTDQISARPPEPKTTVSNTAIFTGLTTPEVGEAQNVVQGLRSMLSSFQGKDGSTGASKAIEVNGTKV
jgi:hypothetical protein